MCTYIYINCGLTYDDSPPGVLSFLTPLYFPDLQSIVLFFVLFSLMVSVSLSVQVRELCKLNIRSGFHCMCVMVSREPVESEREEQHTKGDTSIKYLRCISN